MINKHVCTLFKLYGYFHMCANGGLENFKTVFNLYRSIGKTFSRGCQNFTLNPCIQCFYVRNRWRVSNWFYIAPKEKVHRCGITWPGRSYISCGTASTNSTIRKVSSRKSLVLENQCVGALSCWKTTIK